MAFTIAELMLVVMVIGIIMAVTQKINRERLNYQRGALYYSAYVNLKAAVGNLAAEGCTDTDVTNGFCTTKKALPQVSHTSTSRGFCDRYANELNTIRAVDCTQTGLTTPNFTLTNSQRVFGIGGAASAIPPVTPVTSYLVKIDINGTKGNTTLGEDVFQFVVYLDGTSLPADSAGNDSTYLRARLTYVPETGVITLVPDTRGIAYAKAYCLSLSDTQLALTANPNNSGYCSSFGYTLNSTYCKSNGCQIDMIKPGY